MKVHGDYFGNGYCRLEGLLPPNVVHEVLARIQIDIDRSAKPGNLMKDSPVVGRPALEIYGMRYKPLTFFLWGMTPIISELTQRELLPTYTYFRIYRLGDVCRVHSDREACEHSLSLTLGYSDAKPWALEISPQRVTQTGPIENDFGEAPHAPVSMLPGDAVLYRGVEYRHGRTTPNPNRWSAHLFMHWVDAEGPFKAWAFDQRPSSAKVDFVFS